MLILNLFLLLLSNGLTIRRDVSILYSRAGIYILVVSTISGIYNSYLTFIEKGIGLFNGLFSQTAITNIFQMFLFITTLVILTLTGFFPRKTIGQASDDRHKFNIFFIINKMAEQFTIIEYTLIILFVLMGGSLLMSSGDFVSIFLCIELQSYGLYILSVIYRDSESATSSGLTYFLLGGLSSCFILLGIAFIYVNTGVSSLDSFYVLTNLTTDYEYISSWYKSLFITYSLLIISVGLLFKIGAAPFHFWSPDVYDGIPTIVTTFVAIIAKISILILMLDLVHYTSETLTKTTFDWTTGILISSLLSLIIGTVLGLSQTRIKRLFAYSTISHVGFILLALGVNSIESSKAFMFYLIQYTITNLNGFIILVAIGFSFYLHTRNSLIPSQLKDKNNSPIQLINQLEGFFYINPALSLCLTVVMLSFVGLPPLVGFFAKQMVLASALDNGFAFLVIVAVITSVIAAVYYLGIMKTMFFYENTSHREIRTLDQELNYSANKEEKREKELNKSSQQNPKHREKEERFPLDLKYQMPPTVNLSSYLSITISIITLIILLFILNPNELLYLSDILSIVSFTDIYHF